MTIPVTPEQARAAAIDDLTEWCIKWGWLEYLGNADRVREVCKGAVGRVLEITEPCIRASVGLRWMSYQEFGIPDPANETLEPPTAPFTVGAVGYNRDRIVIYWQTAAAP